MATAPQRHGGSRSRRILAADGGPVPLWRTVLRWIRRLPARHWRVLVVLGALYGHVLAFPVLDMDLPNLTGEEVLHRLEGNPETRSIPVVIISGEATSGQIEPLLSLGRHGYLEKPINVRHLLKVLDERLGASRAHRRREVSAHGDGGGAARPAAADPRR